MNNNELNAISDTIWSNICSIESKNKTKEELINLIKSSIIEVDYNARKVGRIQILNHFEAEISNLIKSID